MSRLYAIVWCMQPDTMAGMEGNLMKALAHKFIYKVKAFALP